MLDVIPYDVLSTITEGAKPGSKVTLHPGWQPERWKELGITRGSVADKFINWHNQRLNVAKRLGWYLTQTCAEYLIGFVPRKGDVISMTGTCMQVTNNSIYGALVNRAGDFTPLCSAVTDRVPYFGLMLPENRHAQVMVKLEPGLNVSNWGEMEYSCLGYYIGGQVSGFKNVVIDGLPPDIPFECLRALVIPLPVSGAVTLCHIVGVTPEAPTLEAALAGKKPEQIIVVGKANLKRTWEQLNVYQGDIVEHVTMGCPHCTIEEIKKIAMLIGSKKLKSSLLIGASVPVVALAREMGYAHIIEKGGGIFLNCCVSIGDPFLSTYYAGERLAKSAATNGARAAHYIARTTGIADTFMGTEEECIDAAATGKWEGREPKW